MNNKQRITKFETQRSHVTTNMKLVVNLIKSILAVIIIGFFAIAVTYLHNYEPAQSKAYTEHVKSYRPLIQSRDLYLDSILNRLEKSIISVKDYTKLYKNRRELYLKDLATYNKIRKEIRAKDSIIGYSSRKNYLLSIGIRISLLVTSLLAFYLVIKYVLNKYRRLFLLVLTGSILFNSTYWVIWAFIYKVNSIGEYDFEPWTYGVMMYSLSVIILLSTYFIFKHYKTLEERLSKMIHILFKGYYEDMEEKNLINPWKQEEYDEFVVEITEKVVEHEK